jgi:hypothetical protein
MEPKYVIGGFITLIVLLVTLQIWVGQKEAEQWAAFAEEHHCKVTEKRTPNSSTMTGITSGGNVAFGTITSNPQTAYLCDDGVTYWR